MDARASLRAFANCFSLSQSSIFFTSPPSVEVALRRWRCSVSVSMGRDAIAPVIEVSKVAFFCFPYWPCMRFYSVFGRTYELCGEKDYFFALDWDKVLVVLFVHQRRSDAKEFAHMELSTVMALSKLDVWYVQKVKELPPFFSEYGLWFVFVSSLRCDILLNI